jgi:hypothetical protein
MSANRRFLLPLTAAVAAVVLPAMAQAETRSVQQKPGTAAAPAQVKQRPAPQAPATAPAQSKSQSAAKPAQKPNAPPAASTAALLPPSLHPTLLGQYDNWGAYWAAPEGRKICFAAARPNGARSNRGRKPAYLFISSRPHDKVKDEISAIASSPFRSNIDASATIGGKTYAMVTSADGAWVKNAADETRLIEAMRKGGDLQLKGTTDRGLQSTDVYSMKGLAQALDRIARECK